MIRSAIAVSIALTGCLWPVDYPSGGGGGDGGITLPTQALAAGGSHVCALLGTKPYCWGDNAYGQLGSAVGASAIGTPTLANSLDVTEIAVGATHSCGIANGIVNCWGDGALGQVDGSTATLNSETPVAPPGAGSIAHVYAGGNATCAIDVAGKLFCWGLINGVALTPTEVDVPGGGTWIGVAIGTDHACALDEQGHAWCWGDNSTEQLGVPGSLLSATHDAPVEKMFGSVPDSLTAIVAEGPRSCGVRSDGSATCWGAGGGGILADNVADFPIAPAGTATAIALGQDHACYVGGDSHVYCFGTNPDGALGNGFDMPHADAEPVAGITSTGPIVAGVGFTCAVDSSSSMLDCWGRNVAGELGNGTIATQKTPYMVGTSYVGIAVGTDHTCGVQTATGGEQAYCWGANDSGQLDSSDGMLAYSTSPVPTSHVAGQYDQIVAGNAHTCVHSSGSGVACWGSDNANQLPDPIKAAGWTWVTAGDDTTCGLNDVGEAFCFGDDPAMGNPNGGDENVMTQYIAAGSQLAVYGTSGMIASVSEFGFDPGMSPGVIAAPGSTVATESKFTPTMVQVAVGERHACALFSETTPAFVTELKCWGDNTSYQSYSTTPSAVPPMTVNNSDGAMNWLVTTPAKPHVAAGGASTCAITGTSQQLVCWGDNSWNQLTDASALPSPVMTPTAIATDMAIVLGWSQVAMGQRDTCALDMAGNLYCWGYNKYGEVGNGARFAPTPTPTLFGQ